MAAATLQQAEGAMEHLLPNVVAFRAACWRLPWEKQLKMERVASIPAVMGLAVAVVPALE
jgi:hypothetical protein